MFTRNSCWFVKIAWTLPIFYQFLHTVNIFILRSKINKKVLVSFMMVARNYQKFLWFLCYVSIKVNIRIQSLGDFLIFFSQMIGCYNQSVNCLGYESGAFSHNLKHSIWWFCEYMLNWKQKFYVFTT